MAYNTAQDMDNVDYDYYDYDSIYSNDTEYSFYSTEDRARIILSKPDKIITLILCFVSVSANVTGLIGITQVKGGSSPRLRLLVSLGCSDILVSLSSLSYLVNRIVNPLEHSPDTVEEGIKSWCILVILKSLTYMAYSMSLMNLLGMAIDHYLAIMRPLHYTTLMNKTKASIMIAIFWILSAIFGFSDFLSGIGVDYSSVKSINDSADEGQQFIYINYCHYVFQSSYHADFLVFFVALICFVVMTWVYLRIYWEVRKHQQRQKRRSPANSEFQKNKKGLITTLLILGTFLVCWLPTFLVEMSLYIIAQVDPELIPNHHIGKIFDANQYLLILPLINSMCDPIIYMTRTAEIRQSCHYWVMKTCKRSSTMEGNGTSYVMVSNGRERCFSNASMTTKTLLENSSVVSQL